MNALPYNERPLDSTPLHTEELPALPQRDRNIPASAWIEVPAAVTGAGADLGFGPDEVLYKRRIGRFLLWRAGPASKADARYIAVDADELDCVFSFRLFADGSGDGTGPSGERHSRFRTWKQDLAGDAASAAGAGGVGTARGDAADGQEN